MACRATSSSILGSSLMRASPVRFRRGDDEVLEVLPLRDFAGVLPGPGLVMLVQPGRGGGLSGANHAAARAAGEPCPKVAKARRYHRAGAPASGSGFTSLTPPLSRSSGPSVDEWPFEEHRRARERRLSGRFRMNAYLIPDPERAFGAAGLRAATGRRSRHMLMASMGRYRTRIAAGHHPLADGGRAARPNLSSGGTFRPRAVRRHQALEHAHMERSVAHPEMAADLKTAAHASSTTP
jgi:hypothetical protein